MNFRFKDRREAGLMLAHRLGEYARRAEVLVLAVSNGGMPVAHAAAGILQVPFDLLVVRPLGVPGNEELAFGFVASGGVQILHSGVVESHGLSGHAIDAVAQRERRTLLRREQVCRGSRPPLAVRGRTILLVDDGAASEATIRSAVLTLRHGGAAFVVVAAPVMMPDLHTAMGTAADRVVPVLISYEFARAGQWYENFIPSTDREVGTLLAGAAPPA